MQLIDDATQLAMLRAVGAELVSFGSLSVEAVVDINYQEAVPGEAIIDSGLIRVECRSIDVPGIGVQSMLLIRGSAHRIISNQPDGQGLTVFICELA